MLLAGLAVTAAGIVVAMVSGGSGRRPFGGFGEVSFSVAPAGRSGCALLAATPDERARGLMGRRDLGGYDAMVFLFEADTTGAFWMRRTPLALSIAFFAADGTFVGSRDMAPCGDDPRCPLYRPPAPYRIAMEVPHGALGRLGVRPGARLVLNGPC